MIKTFTLFGITDVGRQRSHNEDNFVVARDIAANAWGFRRRDIVPAGEAGALLVVADGMGGTNAGEVASHLAQEYVQEAFQQLTDVPGSAAKREAFLRDCIIKAHERIVAHQHANLDTAGMGTTLVIAWVIGNQLHTAWSGDSRCYVYTPGEPLLPFTDDHSMVWDLVKKGKLSAEEARTHPESNLILQSLGSPEQPPKPSSLSTTLYSGDRVLVCSDGLNGMLPDQRIEQVLSEKNGTADTCAELVEHANRAGGEDNITCLLLDVLEADDRPGAATGAAGTNGETVRTVRSAGATTVKNPGLPDSVGQSGRGSGDRVDNPGGGASDHYGIDDGYAAENTTSGGSGSRLWLIIAVLLLVAGTVAYFTLFQTNEDDVTTDPTEEVQNSETVGDNPETPIDSAVDDGATTGPGTDSESPTGTGGEADWSGSDSGSGAGREGEVAPPDETTGDGQSSQNGGDAEESAPAEAETVEPTPSEPSFRIPTDDQSEGSSKPDSGEAEPVKNPAPDSTSQTAENPVPKPQI